MHWSRAVTLLAALRTALLVLGGFGSLAVAGFIWHPVAGWIAVGVALLVIEILTGEDKPRA